MFIVGANLKEKCKKISKKVAGQNGFRPECENQFLPILTLKSCEIPKIFFLQISLFIGAIDGINNIFFSGVPFLVYNDF